MSQSWNLHYPRLCKLQEFETKFQFAQASLNEHLKVCHLRLITPALQA